MLSPYLMQLRFIRSKLACTDLKLTSKCLMVRSRPFAKVFTSLIEFSNWRKYEPRSWRWLTACSMSWTDSDSEFEGWKGSS